MTLQHDLPTLHLRDQRLKQVGGELFSALRTQHTSNLKKLAETCNQQIQFYRFLKNPNGSRERLEQLLAVTEARVANREYVVGDTFTAADIVLASILHLANQLKLLESRPKLYDYTLRHAKRPAVRRALS